MTRSTTLTVKRGEGDVGVGSVLTFNPPSPWWVRLLFWLERVFLGGVEHPDRARVVAITMEGVLTLDRAMPPGKYLVRG
jgi:hypothetical protein